MLEIPDRRNWTFLGKSKWQMTWKKYSLQMREICFEGNWKLLVSINHANSSWYRAILLTVIFDYTTRISINRLNGTRCKRRFDCAFSIEINYTLHLGELIREKFSASIRNAHRNSLFPAEKWCSILSRWRRGRREVSAKLAFLWLEEQGNRTVVPQDKLSRPGPPQICFNDAKNFIFSLANNF